jgi:hypothetical protein
MERCSIDGECIHLARNITKRGELAAPQQGCDVTLDRIDGRTCQEDWGASADTRILHGSTVAMGDLTVIQEEQHGHGLAGLADAPKAGRRRPAAVGESVVHRPSANRSLVVAEEPRANRN